MKKLTIKTQSIERKSTSGQCLVTFLITDNVGSLEWPISVGDHAELSEAEAAARERLLRIAKQIGGRGSDLKATPEEEETIRQVAANERRDKAKVNQGFR